MEQSAIIQKQQAEMAELKDSVQQMKEMMALIVKQTRAPQEIPVPETPPPRAPSLRFATSTPYTGIHGMDTTIGGGEGSLLGLATTNSETSQTRTKAEIKLPDEEKGVVLDTKKLNINFDGSEVELFIKRVEKIASLHKAGGQDVALQLPFMIKDQKISESIENMDGHETRDWELLKKELIRKWGRATPIRRYNEDSINNLVSKSMEKGGIQTKEEYRKFIGELEEILAYLIKMEYEDINAKSGEPLWRAISLELRKDVARGLAHDKKLNKTKDGKTLVPKLDRLKEYVEASLSVTDLEVSAGRPKIIVKAASESKKESKVQIKDEESSRKMAEMEEEIKKLRTTINSNQNQRDFPPHLSNPRPAQNPAFRPSGFGGGPPSRPPLQCYYCKEAEHTSMFCPHLSQDIGKKIVFKQGPNYYYANREPIPTNTSESVRELVRKFMEKTNASGTSDTPEKNANTAAWETMDNDIQTPKASVIFSNRWEAWCPPEVHYGEEEDKNLVGFGLRRSQRIGEKPQDNSTQPSQSQPNSKEKLPEMKSTPKSPPPNQEASKTVPAPRKRRSSYPGAWIEGGSDDGSSEEGDTPQQSKEKGKEPEGKIPLNSVKDIAGKIADRSKVGEGLKKKILKQSFNLTLEELLLISPTFLRELQELTLDENKLQDRSQNSGRCDHQDLEEGLRRHGCTPPMSQRRPSTYACPLGFVDITINKQTVKALVDTGAEMNIMPESLALELKLPTREISMNITGIGGHSTPIVGLAEGIDFNIASEDEKVANFFIARGKVYTVLGRPFLADHGIRLELSKSHGEILSYELWDGGRLCIPICSPKMPGWEMGPPRRINERCCNIRLEEYSNQQRELQYLMDEDIVMEDGSTDSEGAMEGEIITDVEELQLQLARNIDEELQAAFPGEDLMDVDEDGDQQQWISPEHPGMWENWDPKWTENHLYKQETVDNHKLCFPITADYIDQGWPSMGFLLKYPENYGSSANGLWSELPGYTAGRIGFMFLLNWQGTKGYIKNRIIWPEDFWILEKQRLDLYEGGGRADFYLSEHRRWQGAHNREWEEELFLSKVVAKMVAIFGKFSWEGFKWALKDEQNRLGQRYRTFWQDWENIEVLNKI
ncbi:hypothetical protein PGTUg99_012005 [Puccinia graminis f. sp. tritici]|uniref:Peptidase A2 domain-containing protein n=1 Tax=Puccinia graminis f. sp. tritici TaxID=56615 RepID=A0A5B0SJ19_PUCGR|nr:hypothetical protein PGTUg99_012005 [Puccinia graminis f. sp. tritici]